ncbi:protein-L-isoaspartate O-methyltransferase [Xylariomycetidae sp. FL0641]|nr:protein-L-isoaspartate O-methyltransferase [Xylariomycetidae sp. FL0641]
MAWRSSGTTNATLVENLWRNKLITQPVVKAAFQRVDRAHYAPSAPYEDSPQPIGHAATISAPHMHANAVESLLPYLLPTPPPPTTTSTSTSSTSPQQQHDGVGIRGVPGRPRRVLDIGSGSGYLTHLLAEVCCCGGSGGGGGSGSGGGGEDAAAALVVGLEHIPALRRLGERNLAKSDGGRALLAGGRVRFRVGDGRKGWVEEGEEAEAGGGGWDAIHVGAAAVELHDELVRQLRAPGRLFIPVADESGWDQYIWTVDKDEEGKVTRKKGYGVRYVPLTDAPE